MSHQEQYKLNHKIRIISAASLFDGHDASINIMRRILQSSGAEVIHLGHNRSVMEILITAIQEDAQAIALTSYQGGHLEYMKFLHDELQRLKSGHIGIFAGGGGTILPNEIEELHSYGIKKIYSPDDGRKMGLQGMINEVLEISDYSLTNLKPMLDHDIYPWPILSRSLTKIENGEIISDKIHFDYKKVEDPIIIGITGTGGAGKSSLTDEIIRRFTNHFPEKRIAIFSIDPTKKKTGGALLGDRIRMNSIYSPNVFMRSLATRESNLSISKSIFPVIDLVKKIGFDIIIIETAGIGQSDTQIIEISDLSLYVMTPEYGASTQLEKIDMIDYADLIAINKFDRKGASDALRDVSKQFQRSRGMYEFDWKEMPVFGTNASQFNDSGVNILFNALLNAINKKTNKLLFDMPNFSHNQPIQILPPERFRYLSEIVELNKLKEEENNKQIKIANELYHLNETIALLNKNETIQNQLEIIVDEKLKELSNESKALLEKHNTLIKNYTSEIGEYEVRGKKIHVNNYSTSLSGLKISKVSIPKYKAWGDILKWIYKENFPGQFPFTSGVFPYKRSNEDPIRMFAGEGYPERTNKRFHYLSYKQPAIRLSTAFDSVTLYGEDPDIRPDIFGKIGNSGVSIASLDDAKRLYSGFNLCQSNTSVSMTINGPAPIVLAFYLNAAIDQQCEIYIKKNGLSEQVNQKIDNYFFTKGMERPTYRENLPSGNDGLGLFLLGVTGNLVLPTEIYENIKKEAISTVRGTVQADILKEDQAQNTCIFSTEFALKMMGDVQEYFIKNNVRNFYSVSISGYHMAEAGANPITQLAFTLANGFTYIEYYLSRGMKIDEFCPNFSFFFSNGIDPEYSVLGRVARRIWAKAIKFKYNGNERSQILKYHIQTSGRSLHAQEIQFNDIRTTLQALYAIYDNCNSLHTNAYDEAITTPTEESVRRAVAIQLIINKELGLAKNENPMQGSFIIDELSDLVEQAVYTEFHRITDRGGVLGAMETMYQRNKIQDESIYYEHLKHNGEYPIVGVNTFLDPKGSPTIIPAEVIRSTNLEKELQILGIKNLHKLHSDKIHEYIELLEDTAIQGKNVFETLVETSKVLSLGQMTNCLYKIGGQFRRNT
jgi:isobutyryl-CoA mutase